LTLTGTGGVGKTRLAVELAGNLVDAGFSDGVWFVELATTTDAAGIVHAIANTLRVSQTHGLNEMDALVDALRARRLLLLLDNCEHVLQACAELVDHILRRCPLLSILTTSREPLGILGETVRLVPPLSRPSQDSPASLDDLAHCDSVQLFTDRARATASDFALEAPDKLAAIARICNRLDGIPLALELAAARVRVLSLSQVADRLEQDLQFLAAGNRAGPPRQRTLEATLSWSYDLLSEADRRVFAQLAVFAGSWSLEAAEAICGGDVLSPGQVFIALDELVQKSLVVAEDVDDTGKRYRLLEPLRQFALDKLSRQGGEGEIRQRHFAWYARVAAESERVIRLNPGTSSARARLLTHMQSDLDNLREALRWAATADGDILQGLRMAGSLLSFWYHGELIFEGRSWLTLLLERRRGAGPGAERAEALSAATVLAQIDGDLASVRRLTREYLDLPEQAQSDISRAAIYNGLGAVDVLEGHYASARRHIGHALELSHASGEVVGSLYTADLGRVALLEGNLDEARHVFETAIAEAEAAQLPPLAGVALSRLAWVEWCAGESQRAERVYERALSTLRFHPAAALPQAAVTVLLALGYLALERGDPGRAKDRFVETLNCSARLGGRAVGPALRAVGRLLLETAISRGDPVDTPVRLLGAAANFATAWTDADRDCGGFNDLDVRARGGLSLALRAARERTAERHVDALLKDGQAWPLEQAIAEARTAAAALAD
jgi:non-specific serine/threonine protein kinase